MVSADTPLTLAFEMMVERLTKLEMQSEESMEALRVIEESKTGIAN